jgi:hypothetical protein
MNVHQLHEYRRNNVGDTVVLRRRNTQKLCRHNCKRIPSNKVKSKQLKPPCNGGYRSEIPAPVMVKPPPATNTFPVKRVKLQIRKTHDTTMKAVKMIPTLLTRLE